MESTEQHRVIKRVPFPHSTDLPRGLQPAAKSLKGSLSEHAYKHFLRDISIHHYGNLFLQDKNGFFAELDESENKAAKRRKSMYAGALQVLKSTKGTYDLGIYNPDRITVEVYDRMRRHSQVALGLALIKKPIEHVTFSVHSESDEVKALIHWNLKKIYRELISDLLLSVDYGASFLEKTYTKIPNLVLKRRLPDGSVEVLYEGETQALKTYSIHPNSLKVVINKKGEFLGVLQVPTNGGWGKKVAIKRRKLVFKINEMEFGNWWGTSRLKAAYTWWYWSELCLQFMMRYLERKASPPVVVVAPEGQSHDSSGKLVNNFDMALGIGTGLTSNAVGVLPNEIDSKSGKQLWDIKYLMDDQRVFMFIEVLVYFNKMISRSLWVPDNVGTQDGSSGFSVTDARTDIHLVIEEALIGELETTINNQIIPDLVKKNFPPERRAAASVSIEKLTVTRKLMLKELLMKMLGTVNQFASKGGLFKTMPDFGSILTMLEIPSAPIGEMIDFSGWDTSSTPSGDDNGDDDNTSKEKEDDNNKDKKRRPRTRGEKRPKVAA